MEFDQESYTEKIHRMLVKRQRVVRVAAGREPADLVMKNASYVNVFSNQICAGDIAVAEGLIAGVGCAYRGREEIDLAGKLLGGDSGEMVFL